MSDIVKRLNDFSIRYAHEDERQATIRRNETVKDAVDRIAALEAENAELRQSIKAAWVSGRKAWCPAAILDDQERTERDWQQALAALEDKP